MRYLPAVLILTTALAAPAAAQFSSHGLKRQGEDMLRAFVLPQYRWTFGDGFEETQEWLDLAGGGIGTQEEATLRSPIPMTAVSLAIRGVEVQANAWVNASQACVTLYVNGAATALSACTNGAGATGTDQANVTINAGDDLVLRAGWTGGENAFIEATSALGILGRDSVYPSRADGSHGLYSISGGLSAVSDGYASPCDVYSDPPTVAPCPIDIGTAGNVYGMGFWYAPRALSVRRYTTFNYSDQFTTAYRWWVGGSYVAFPWAAPPLEHRTCLNPDVCGFAVPTVTSGNIDGAARVTLERIGTPLVNGSGAADTSMLVAYDLDAPRTDRSVLWAHAMCDADAYSWGAASNSTDAGIPWPLNGYFERVTIAAPHGTPDETVATALTVAGSTVLTATLTTSDRVDVDDGLVPVSIGQPVDLITSCGATAPREALAFSAVFKPLPWGASHPTTTTSTSVTTSTVATTTSSSSSTSTVVTTTSSSTSTAPGATTSTSTVTTTTTSTTVLANVPDDWSADTRLLGYWTFNSPETDGDPATDYSPSGNDLPDYSDGSDVDVVRADGACNPAGDACSVDADCSTSGNCYSREGQGVLAGGANDKFFACDDATCPDFDQAFTALSVGGWGRRQSTGSPLIAAKRVNTTNGGFDLWAPTTGTSGTSAFNFRVTDTTNGNLICASQVDTSTQNQWYYAGGTLTTAGGLLIMVDGEEASCQTDSASCHDITFQSTTCALNRATPLGVTSYDVNDELFRVCPDRLSSSVIDNRCDDVFMFEGDLHPQSWCRLCSCGWQNEGGCSCDTGTPTDWDGLGWNATLCGSCDFSDIACNATPDELPILVSEFYVEDKSQTANLVGLWLLNESGTTDPADSSSTGNTLATGTPAYITSGNRREGARKFVRITSGTGTVSCADATCPTLGIHGSGAEVTFSAWLDPGVTTDTDGGWPLRKLDTTTPTAGYGIEDYDGSSDNQARCVIGDGTTTHVCTLSVDSLLDSSTSYLALKHIACRMDGGELTGFVNGELVACAEGTVSPTAIGNNAEPFTLDVEGWETSAAIDTAMVYAGDLTDAAICEECSCGWTNHRGCFCNPDGTWADGGRGVNATLCGGCTLPTDCLATDPGEID